MILSMLRDVIQEDGTGTKARINGVVLAGKTGTAQKAEQGGYSERFLASFAALVPGDIPEYVILAMIDEPHPVHYGGLVAAPAVREVALNILSGQGRLPSAQPMDMLQADHRESPGINLDSASGNTLQIGMETADGQGTVPDLVGLSLHNVVQWCLEQGIVPKVQGQGIFVHRQQPAPGSAWPDAENGLTLWLSREGRSG
jgi:cell division protein FtsI (penicillin-binding protein 3)